jgi:hypothetical protein
VPGGQEIVSRENAAYARWMRHVAESTLVEPRSVSRRLLRFTDPSYTMVMLDDDRNLVPCATIRQGARNMIGSGSCNGC